MVHVGDTAPVFSAMNQDDNACSLADYQGQWLVLYFYPKDDTPGCTTESCGFSELISEFAKINASVVGVSPDSTESHRKFINKHGLKLDLLSDPEKEILQAYEAWGVKKNYGREYEGVIRSTFIIDPEGVVAATWRNVRVNGHVETVRKKLQALQSKLAAS